jgi:hypothetical protein
VSESAAPTWNDEYFAAAKETDLPTVHEAIREGEEVLSFAAANSIASRIFMWSRWKWPLSSADVLAIETHKLGWPLPEGTPIIGIPLPLRTRWRYQGSAATRAALNIWQEKRLEIAHSVVKMTDRMTTMATASSYGVKLLRNAVLSIVGQIPFAWHALAGKLSELENR